LARGIFAKIARDFQMIFFYSYPEFVMGGFFLPSGTNVFNFSIRTILQRNALGCCNLNTYEDEEVVFIGQRIGEPLKWRHIRRNMEADNIEDKIHCIASNLAETLLESSLTICHYVKVQQLDVICETRRYKANQTAKYGG
jgi:hypothetical protein